MSAPREYVKSLLISELEDIVASYEKFEEQGYIGDEPIRIYANHFLNVYSLTGLLDIVSCMNQLAFECYRLLYIYYKTINIPTKRIRHD